MLTLFTTPKPFRGHIGVIQRNALASWTRLGPNVEVILFGDDDGAESVARELGIRHVPEAPRHPSGFKYLNAFFAQAQQIARNPVVCYANCDIIFLPDMLDAVRRVADEFPRFLMVGRRRDLDITSALPFEDPDWAPRLRERAVREGLHRVAGWIDYFVFPRGFYEAIPPFVIGRIAWDQWLVWRARDLGAPVVDASSRVTAIHQNHDYAYHPQGAIGVWQDELAGRNIELAGGFRCLHTIADATYRLETQALTRRWLCYLVPFRRAIRRGIHDGLSASLRVTRPLRHALGLRKQHLEGLRSKPGVSRGE